MREYLTPTVKTLDPSTNVLQPGTNGDAERYPFSGIHSIASYIKCNPERLLDQRALTAALRDAIEAAGATILNHCEQTFPNGGFTTIVLLAESHASVHTYPEHGSCFVDFFTCGRGCDPARFDEIFKSYIQPERSTQKVILRSDLA
jgi:S-adenosylmethionine decarboxylase proenzyme